VRFAIVILAVSGSPPLGLGVRAMEWQNDYGRSVRSTMTVDANLLTKPAIKAVSGQLLTYPARDLRVFLDAL
jgi:hypothetical protein